MKAKTCLALALAAGCASVAVANDTPALRTDGVHSVPTSQIGHIYYNVATGEMIQTAGKTQLRDSQGPIWVNETYDQCGFGEWFFYGYRNGATGLDDYIMDYGQIDYDSVVDCVTMLYATNEPDPTGAGVAGLEVTLTYFDGIDIGILGSPAAVPYFALNVTDLPGSATGGFAGWLLTIDFAGTGIAWEVGDHSGTDDSGNGFNSGYGPGVDLDGSGQANFGYGYNFDIPAASVSLIGSGMALPDPSLGDGDNMGVYDGSWDFLDYIGLFWFGGYDCSGGSGFNWSPFASFYLGMYGPTGGGPTPCPCDLNNDQTCDFFDVQTFLQWFSAQDPRADLNNDGLWDFFDVQIYLQLFSNGCP